MGSKGSYLPSAPLAERELSQVTMANIGPLAECLVKEQGKPMSGAQEEVRG
jgi:hypothetical protein